MEDDDFDVDIDTLVATGIRLSKSGPVPAQTYAGGSWGSSIAGNSIGSGFNNNGEDRKGLTAGHAQHAGVSAAPAAHPAAYTAAAFGTGPGTHLNQPYHHHHHHHHQQHQQPHNVQHWEPAALCQWPNSHATQQVQQSHQQQGWHTSAPDWAAQQQAPSSRGHSQLGGLKAAAGHTQDAAPPAEPGPASVQTLRGTWPSAAAQLDADARQLPLPQPGAYIKIKAHPEAAIPLGDSTNCRHVPAQMQSHCGWQHQQQQCHQQQVVQEQDMHMVTTSHTMHNSQHMQQQRGPTLQQQLAQQQAPHQNAVAPQVLAHQQAPQQLLQPSPREQASLLPPQPAAPPAPTATPGTVTHAVPGAVHTEAVHQQSLVTKQSVTPRSLQLQAQDSPDVCMMQQQEGDEQQSGLQPWQEEQSAPSYQAPQPGVGPTPPSYQGPQEDTEPIPTSYQPQIGSHQARQLHAGPSPASYQPHVGSTPPSYQPGTGPTPPSYQLAQPDPGPPDSQQQQQQQQRHVTANEPITIDLTSPIAHAGAHTAAAANAAMPSSLAIDMMGSAGTQAGFLQGIARCVEPQQTQAVLMGVDQAGPAVQQWDKQTVNLMGSPQALLPNPHGHAVHPQHTRFWIYPCHKEVRQYQMAMTSKALFANTLVCLPTGLGKTLIAAVVMVNHYRWFPEGKVVFVAPTKPLVTQQRDACRCIMGVSQEEAVELTAGGRANRQELWNTKRLFFCTPDILKNDLATGKCPEKSIVCLVVDECHHAVGDAAASKVVQQLRAAKTRFRLLGLSATPGSNTQAIQAVINNLSIAHLEYRNERDGDVAPYCHDRDVEVIGVKADGRLEQCSMQLKSLLLAVVRQLVSATAISGLSADVSRSSLMQAQQAYQQRGAGCVDKSSLLKVHCWFKQALCLATACEALAAEGPEVALGTLRHATNSQQEVRDLFSSTAAAQQLLQSLTALAACPHPKLQRLQQELLTFFKQGATDQGEGNMQGKAIARAIVFTTMRSSVNTIVEALARHAPAIRARCFIGQGNRGKGSKGDGMNQAEQKEVLAAFRDGTINLLVATCIGEEGLDIPEVDLIICYDSSASPTRQNQRMGRTARHRDGRVVYILEDPREVDKYHASQEEFAKLQGYLRNAGRFFDMSRSGALPLLPPGCHPQPLLMDLQAAGLALPEDQAGKKKKKRSSGEAGATAGKKAQQPTSLNNETAEMDVRAGQAAIPPGTPPKKRSGKSTKAALASEGACQDAGVGKETVTEAWGLGIGTNSGAADWGLGGTTAPMQWGCNRQGGTGLGGATGGRQSGAGSSCVARSTAVKPASNREVKPAATGGLQPTFIGGSAGDSDEDKQEEVPLAARLQQRRQQAKLAASGSSHQAGTVTGVATVSTAAAVLTRAAPETDTAVRARAVPETDAVVLTKAAPAGTNATLTVAAAPARPPSAAVAAAAVTSITESVPSYQGKQSRGIVLTPPTAGLGACMGGLDQEPKAFLYDVCDSDHSSGQARLAADAAGAGVCSTALTPTMEWAARAELRPAEFVAGKQLTDAQQISLENAQQVAHAETQHRSCVEVIKADAVYPGQGPVAITTLNTVMVHGVPSASLKSPTFDLQPGAYRPPRMSDAGFSQAFGAGGTVVGAGSGAGQGTAAGTAAKHLGVRARYIVPASKQPASSPGHPHPTASPQGNGHAASHADAAGVRLPQVEPSTALPALCSNQPQSGVHHARHSTQIQKSVRFAEHSMVHGVPMQRCAMGPGDSSAGVCEAMPERATAVGTVDAASAVQQPHHGLQQCAELLQPLQHEAVQLQQAPMPQLQQPLGAFAKQTPALARLRRLQDCVALQGVTDQGVDLDHHSDPRQHQDQHAAFAAAPEGHNHRQAAVNAGYDATSMQPCQPYRGVNMQTSVCRATAGALSEMVFDSQRTVTDDDEATVTATDSERTLTQAVRPGLGGEVSSRQPHVLGWQGHQGSIATGVNQHYIDRQSHARGASLHPSGVQLRIQHHSAGTTAQGGYQQHITGVGEASCGGVQAANVLHGMQATGGVNKAKAGKKTKPPGEGQKPKAPRKNKTAKPAAVPGGFIDPDNIIMTLDDVPLAERASGKSSGHAAPARHRKALKKTKKKPAVASAQPNSICKTPTALCAAAASGQGPATVVSGKLPQLEDVPLLYRLVCSRASGEVLTAPDAPNVMHTPANITSMSGASNTPALAAGSCTLTDKQAIPAAGVQPARKPTTAAAAAATESKPAPLAISAPTATPAVRPDSDVVARPPGPAHAAGYRWDVSNGQTPDTPGMTAVAATAATAPDKAPATMAVAPGRATAAPTTVEDDVGELDLPLSARLSAKRASSSATAQSRLTQAGRTIKAPAMHKATEQACQDEGQQRLRSEQGQAHAAAMEAWRSSEIQRFHTSGLQPQQEEEDSYQSDARNMQQQQHQNGLHQASMLQQPMSLDQPLQWFNALHAELQQQGWHQTDVQQQTAGCDEYHDQQQQQQQEGMNQVGMLQQPMSVHPPLQWFNALHAELQREGWHQTNLQQRTAGYDGYHEQLAHMSDAQVLAPPQQQPWDEVEPTTTAHSHDAWPQPSQQQQQQQQQQGLLTDGGGCTDLGVRPHEAEQYACSGGFFTDEQACQDAVLERQQPCYNGNRIDRPDVTAAAVRTDVAASDVAPPSSVAPLLPQPGPSIVGTHYQQAAPPLLGAEVLCHQQQETQAQQAQCHQQQPDIDGRTQQDVDGSSQAEYSFDASPGYSLDCVPDTVVKPAQPHLDVLNGGGPDASQDAVQHKVRGAARGKVQLSLLLGTHASDVQGAACEQQAWGDAHTGAQGPSGGMQPPPPLRSVAPSPLAPRVLNFGAPHYNCHPAPTPQVNGVHGGLITSGKDPLATAAGQGGSCPDRTGSVAAAPKRCATAGMPQTMTAADHLLFLSSNPFPRLQSPRPDQYPCPDQHLHPDQYAQQQQEKQQGMDPPGSLGAWGSSVVEPMTSAAAHQPGDMDPSAKQHLLSGDHQQAASMTAAHGEQRSQAADVLHEPCNRAAARVEDQQLSGVQHNNLLPHSVEPGPATNTGDAVSHGTDRHTPNIVLVPKQLPADQGEPQTIPGVNDSPVWGAGVIAERPAAGNGVARKRHVILDTPDSAPAGKKATAEPAVGAVAARGRGRSSRVILDTPESQPAGMQRQRGAPEGRHMAAAGGVTAGYAHPVPATPVAGNAQPQGVLEVVELLTDGSSCPGQQPCGRPADPGSTQVTPTLCFKAVRGRRANARCIDDEDHEDERDLEPRAGHGAKAGAETQVGEGKGMGNGMLQPSVVMGPPPRRLPQQSQQPAGLPHQHHTACQPGVQQQQQPWIQPGMLQQQKQRQQGVLQQQQQQQVCLMDSQVVLLSPTGPTPPPQPLSRLQRGPQMHQPAAAGTGYAARGGNRVQVKGGAAGKAAGRAAGSSKRARRNHFIDMEADHSGQEDGSEEGEGEDEDLEGFIQDEGETPARSGGSTPGMAMYLGWGLTQNPESVSKVDIAALVRRKGRQGAAQHSGEKRRRAAEQAEALALEDDDILPHERGIDLGANTQMPTDAYEDDDDLCAMCGEDGELLMCDGCDRGYHLECVGKKHIPVHDWFCTACRRAGLHLQQSPDDEDDAGSPDSIITDGTAGPPKHHARPTAKTGSMVHALNDQGTSRQGQHGQGQHGQGQHKQGQHGHGQLQHGQGQHGQLQHPGGAQMRQDNRQAGLQQMQQATGAAGRPLVAQPQPHTSTWQQQQAQPHGHQAPQTNQQQQQQQGSAQISEQQAWRASGPQQHHASGLQQQHQQPQPKQGLRQVSMQQQQVWQSWQQGPQREQQPGPGRQQAAGLLPQPQPQLQWQQPPQLQAWHHHQQWS